MALTPALRQTLSPIGERGTMQYVNIFFMHPAFPDVKIDQFEGPYDVLVELAKKQKVNLSEISLQKLTEPFLIYIQEHNIPPESVASFIIVASTLLLIKAREMLPQLKQEEEEEITDFTQRLQLYERYRKAGEHFGLQWGKAPLLPASFFAEGNKKATQAFSFPAGLLPETLANSLKQKTASIPVIQPKAHLTQRGKSLTEILSLFQTRLTTSSILNFQESIHGISRQEQAVSFLAILEMARNQEVQLEQLEAFGTLVVHKI